MSCGTEKTLDFYCMLDGAGGVGGLLAVNISPNNNRSDLQDFQDFQDLQTSADRSAVGGVWYFLLYDNNGNITDYVSEDGEVVASYEYDAFGRTISQSGAMADEFPFRFSTKYYDAEAKLYYYGERFYSPELGRWLNRDPIEEDGGGNLYMFCGNNGVGKVDPMGNFTIYVHSDGFGHVGIYDVDGTSYDYGRYRGTYSGLGTIASGPNILVRNINWMTMAKNHQYDMYHFGVCPTIDDVLKQVLSDRFSAGMSELPPNVMSRLSRETLQLSEHERYMMTDWTINDNCMTFTLRSIASTVTRMAGTQPSSLEKRQLRTMLSLSFRGSFALFTSNIKSMLDKMAADYAWIDHETTERKDDNE